jgi:hypothetical protein
LYGIERLILRSESQTTDEENLEMMMMNAFREIQQSPDNSDGAPFTTREGK